MKQDSQTKETGVHATLLQRDHVGQDDGGQRLNTTTTETLNGPPSDEHGHATSTATYPTTKREER